MIDDVGRFRDKFKECFKDVDQQLAKIQLKQYCLPIDIEHFNGMLNQSLDELLEQFFIKYNGLAATNAIRFFFFFFMREHTYFNKFFGFFSKYIKFHI